MSKHTVPEWNRELAAMKAQGPPKILLDPPPTSWSCKCPRDRVCTCCEWGEWPACDNCNKHPRSGIYFYKSHKPTTQLYYCYPCFSRSLDDQL